MYALYLLIFMGKGSETASKCSLSLVRLDTSNPAVMNLFMPLKFFVGGPHISAGLMWIISRDSTPTGVVRLDLFPQAHLLFPAMRAAD
jgi:hypothetical protein